MKKDLIIRQLKSHLPSKNAKRLFHGRGCLVEGWEQINIELYGSVLWVMVYMAIDEEDLMAVLEAAKIEAEQLGLTHIYIQRRFQQGNPVELFLGNDSYLETDFKVQIDDLFYWVNLGKNQNSGLFLDMSAGRDWIRKNSSGKAVLNLFSYTCSLGIVAAAGGARSVLNVDMSKSVIKRGQQNAALNDLSGCNTAFIAQDIFKMVKKINQKGPYDLLIADPPSFQSKAFDVRRGYEKLLEKFKVSMAPNGLLMLCLNSPNLKPDFLMELMARIIPEATFVERLANDPVLADKDEDASLKVLIFKMPEA